MKNVTFRQLRVFTEVARQLSFARAAEALHLTPPAVTMQVKELESQVGLPLFERSGRSGQYMDLLVDHFNPETVPGLMCRDLVSIGYDGSLYDCDFNQMLELDLAGGTPRTIWQVENLAELEGDPVATASHCFGCTAGAGSSCGGSLA